MDNLLYKKDYLLNILIFLDFEDILKVKILSKNLKNIIHKLSKNNYLDLYPLRFTFDENKLELFECGFVGLGPKNNNFSENFFNLVLLKKVLSKSKTVDLAGYRNNVNIYEKFKYLKCKNKILDPYHLFVYIFSDCLNIVNLNLSCNYLDNFSFLEKFNNLKILDLVNNRIINCSFILEIKNLKELYIDYNIIDNIDCLSDHKKLTFLSIRNNKIIRIKKLPPKLEKLDISYNKVKILNLEHRNLTHMDISHNCLEKIEYLRLDNLEVLDVHDNKLDSINHIVNCTKLEELELGRNNITKLNGISNITKLKKLYLYENKVKQCSEFKYLYNLEELDVSHNGLINIDLSKNNKIKYLELTNNCINNIILNSNNKIYFLSLCNNRINDKSELQNLKNISVLDLSYNNLSNIDFLQNSEKTNKLDISYNYNLDDNDTIMTLENLDYINVDNTLIDMGYIF